MTDVTFYFDVSNPCLFFSVSNAGIDEASLTIAVKQFQSYFGLDDNGEFDNETLQLMNQPRCGDKGTIYITSITLHLVDIIEFIKILILDISNIQN